MLKVNIQLALAQSVSNWSWFHLTTCPQLAINETSVRIHLREEQTQESDGKNIYLERSRH